MIPELGQWLQICIIAGHQGYIIKVSFYYVSIAYDDDMRQESVIMQPLHSLSNQI